MSKNSNKCVHTEHCCRIDGCKYGDIDCPVYLGYKCQSFLCEQCTDSFDELTWSMTLKDLPKVRFDEFKRRREAAEIHTPFCLEDDSND